MNSKNALAILFFLICMLFLGLLYVVSARAADVTLAWDSVAPPVDGYRVYQRIEGAQYDYTSAPAWQGAETTCTIKDLSHATQYYFVVRAFLAADESGDSNEVGFKGILPAPGNLRIDIEISVYIDVNGTPYVKAELNNAKGDLPME